jgi:hypothetical protein
MNEEGVPQKKFIVDSLIESTKLPREQFAAVIDKCSEFEGNDACANAYHVREIFNLTLKVLIDR